MPEDALLETGKRYAEEMLLASPMGLRLTKEGLNVAIDAPGLKRLLLLKIEIRCCAPHQGRSRRHACLY
ncbi:MAG: hypothetical protein CM15mP120_04590 [Pseudomonadota bacterium]|nr:MAG: hypothetical protein CM15mP120_04590 [Pseudomonadota bacterium]